MITVAVVDDQELVREGFTMMLNHEPDLRVVLEAENGQRLLDALATSLRVDVVLLDLRMPILDGLATLDHLNVIAHRPKVLVVTTFERDEMVLEALARGADGYLLKRGSRSELLRAVRLVASGRSVLAPEVTRSVITQLRQQPREVKNSLAAYGLTPRETEVLRMVARGLTNVEVADQLSLSPHTVKTHFTSVLAKTRARDRVQVTLLAIRAGLT